MLIPNGFLIVFEGIGGSGKSTLATQLADDLDRAGWVVERTREPGGTDLGNELRRLLRGNENATDAWAEAFLFEADRAQTYTYVIGPALRAGRVVVSDRGPFGTVAYQGHGRGLDCRLIDAMNSAAWRTRRADLVFVLDVEPTIAMGRRRSTQTDVDRFDDEGLSYQSSVRNGYLAAAREFGPAAHILDGRLSLQELSAAILRLSLDGLDKASAPGGDPRSLPS